MHPPTPVSNHLQVGLDGIHTTPSEVGQWSGGARKRKQETSLSQVQQLQLPFSSPAARSLLTLHDEQYYGRSCKSRLNNTISSSASDGGGYMPNSPPGSLSFATDSPKPKGEIGLFLDRSGYETDQPSPSVVRAHPGPSSWSNGAQCSSSLDPKMSSLFQPPPSPAEGTQHMYDKVISFLRDKIYGGFPGLSDGRAWLGL